MNILKTAIFTVFIAVVIAPAGSYAMDMNEREILAYQVDVSRELMEYVSEMFTRFSEGYVEADEAIKKLSMWNNEYNKAVQPVLSQGEKLDDLMKKFFSQIENYFIFYKRANRENPEINIKMVETRNELTREAQKLTYMLSYGGGQ